MTRRFRNWLWRTFKAPRPTPEIRRVTALEKRIRASKKAYYARLREIRHAAMRKELGHE